MASPQEQEIVQIFMKNVYGKSPDTSQQNQNHDGKKGHWLEKQMGIKPNASNAPDLLGFEMKNQTTSKTTFGDTEYVAYGSISIEQLEFISLDKKFDRASMIIKEGEGEKIAETVQAFIQQLDPSRQPKAIFHANYVRKGTIFEEGEVGILLDNTAIDILVNETLSLLRELSIKQAKGYMYVESVEVDYNDSNKMMRIKRHPDQANPEPQADYAVYFEAQD